MSNCTNCFSGCAEISSDQCIKYTGLAIPELNINNGDTLATVELAVTNYLVSTLDGSGIYPLVSESIICEIISKYFVACAPCDGLTLNELLTAMVKAVCDLQEQINDTNAIIASTEEPYTLGCLTGVTSNVFNTVINGGSLKLGQMLKDGLIERQAFCLVSFSLVPVQAKLFKGSQDVVCGARLHARGVNIFNA